MKQGYLEVEIETLSHVLIGSGATFVRPSLNIVLLRRKAGDKNKIFIPGSTIKGLLRINASRLAHFLEMESCYSIKDPKPCDVCRIFGMPNLESKILVSDAYPKEDVIPLILMGVTINRKTGTAAKEQLYSYEAIPPHTCFQFRIILKDFTPKETDLVFLALHDLQYQRFGRGAGRIRYRILNMNNIELPSLSERIKEQYL
ncbi:MAG: RAMP superfamily CRISPR-associated protein [Promethearchaeota archaeon]